jgi:hypothetical protein
LAAAWRALDSFVAAARRHRGAWEALCACAWQDAVFVLRQVEAAAAQGGAGHGSLGDGSRALTALLVSGSAAGRSAVLHCTAAALAAPVDALAIHLAGCAPRMAVDAAPQLLAALDALGVPPSSAFADALATASLAAGDGAALEGGLLPALCAAARSVQSAGRGFAPLLLPQYPAALLAAARYLAFGLIALPLGWLAWAQPGSSMSPKS